MRTLCDVCEGAAAVFFCAADEAALCRACDEKVHLCNKLASRHIRVGIAAPNAVPRCDICENAPAFFYCEIDGSSLCLQCDMVVHVGGKRTHRRYLLLRQRAEFPGDKPGLIEDRRDQNQSPHSVMREREQNHVAPVVPTVNGNTNADTDMDNNMFDLNARPQRIVEQTPNNQLQGPDGIGTHNDSASVVPGAFKSESEK